MPKKSSPKNPAPAPLAIITKPMTLATLGGPKFGDTASLTAITVKLHQEIGLTVGRAVWLSAYCGRVLTDLKKSLPHGEWLKYFAEKLETEGLSERTGRVYMELWKAAQARLVKSAGSADLADKPLSQLTPGDNAKLIEALQKVCDGETARELCGSVMEDVGIARKAHGHGLKGKAGGARDRKGELTEEEEEAALNDGALADRDELVTLIARIREESSIPRFPTKSAEDRRILQSLLQELAEIQAKLKSLLK
jgi:hypothetical protein